MFTYARYLDLIGTFFDNVCFISKKVGDTQHTETDKVRCTVHVPSLVLLIVMFVLHFEKSW